MKDLLFLASAVNYLLYRDDRREDHALMAFHRRDIGALLDRLRAAQVEQLSDEDLLTQFQEHYSRSEALRAEIKKRAKKDEL
jgi:hypothetical protein